MQSLSHAAAALFWTVVWALAGPTIVLLVLRRYVPLLGNPLWQAYRRLLGWAAAAPFRLLRALTREALNRRR
jgi:hypothetical protein